MKLVRRLFVLGCLTACLGVFNTGFGAKALNNNGSAAVRICCSACDADPIPLPCYSGCNPGC
jgi:hypothetical protein